MTTDRTLDDIAARVERMERMCAALANVLGSPAEPCRPPEDRPHTLEQARWVAKGDLIQAVHGDPVWEPVVSTVHADEQTGLVTRTGDGATRLRWWGHMDRVKVATAPVPDPTPFRFVPLDEDLVEARHRAATGGL